MDQTVEGISSAIIDAARHPFLILGPGLRIITANPAFCRTFRVKLEDILGQPLDQVCNSTLDIPSLKRALQAMPHTGASFDDIEVEVPFSGSQKRIMRVSARLVEPNPGPEFQTVLSIEDITDRLRTEQAMRDSEVRFRRLFETAQDGILILDEDTGKIENANPFLAHLMGSRPADLVGKELWEIGFFDNQKAFQSVYRTLKETGYCRFDDLPLATQDGRQIEVEFVCNVYPVGERLMIQCNIRDVSDRKRSERALQKAEVRLRHSLKSEAIAKLAGGVAHEYNNLLTAINGFASLSLARPDPDGLFHADLKEILKAGGRAAGLTRQLLAYSRQLVLEPRLLDPNFLVTRVRHMAEELMGSGIGLEEELSEDVGLVKADPQQIEQVLLNLVINARNAMPEGGRLTLKTGRAELNPENGTVSTALAPGHYALMSISDTGIGMGPDVKERIFDPFYTTQALPGGPGLGLSMVEGIVAQSGGCVVAESEPGQGSTFKVYLPIVGERTGKEVRAALRGIKRRPSSS